MEIGSAWCVRHRSFAEIDQQAEARCAIARSAEGVPAAATRRRTGRPRPSQVARADTRPTGDRPCVQAGRNCSQARRPRHMGMLVRIQRTRTGQRQLRDLLWKQNGTGSRGERCSAGVKGLNIGTVLLPVCDLDGHRFWMDQENE